MYFTLHQKYVCISKCWDGRLRSLNFITSSNTFIIVLCLFFSCAPTLQEESNKKRASYCHLTSNTCSHSTIDIMKLAIASLLVGSAAAFTSPSGNVAQSTALNAETLEDLSVLAKKLNPIIPRFDPLGLSTQNFWGTSQEATIGFLRESEVKHGRIAMFAFVGYIVHANGIRWPWPMTLDGTPFPETLNPPEAWDAIPDAAKLQIFAFVGFLEYVSSIQFCLNFSFLDLKYACSSRVTTFSFS